MNKSFNHLKTVLHHRHLVIKHGFKLGIGFHCLFHDLSKFSSEEFVNSAKHYQGFMTPVYDERMANDYFSYIVAHHTGRNKHHWEYWVETFKGNMVIKTMPYIYCLEYIADSISASKTYGKEKFKNSDPYEYFLDKVKYYYITNATKEFLLWGLKTYKDEGFEGLTKEKTYKKYKEICSQNKDVEVYKIVLETSELEEIKK